MEEKEVLKNNLGKNNVPDKQGKKGSKIAIIVIVGFVLLVAAFIFVGNSLTNFEFKGTGYSVVNEGELKFYKAQIPMISNGVHVADYNLYLHEDPRTLEDIYLSNPEVVVTQNIVVATDDDFNCDGDGIIALANFAKLYQTFGAKVFKNDSLQCDRYAPYTHVLFHKADETGIDKPKHNCYVVNVNNCEILRASEKFMIESLANVNRYYNQ